MSRRSRRTQGGAMESDRPDEISKEQREFSRRRFLRRLGVAAAGVPLYGGLAGILSEQGASAATYKRNDDNAFFASHPKYKFVMVNHVTTNSFFTATIYGIQDACALTGCSYQWTGSATSIVSQMVAAFNAAHRRQGEGHRVLPDRQHRLQRSHGQCARATASPCSRTTPTSRRGPRTTGCATSARTT